MHSVWVDDVRLPMAIGGHVALDLCNTYAGWNDPIVPAGEWLKTYDVLAVWGRYVGLYDEDTARHLRRTASRDPEGARDALRTTRTFRTQLHTALLDPTDGRALAGVTGLVRRAAQTGSLVPGTDGAHWQLGREAGLWRPVLQVAREAEALLTSERLSQLRVCPGHECGWMFLDPRGRRRWCHMSSCGNRAKVAAHAARARGGRAGEVSRPGARGGGAARGRGRR